MTYIFTGFFIHDIDLGNINSIELSQIDGDSVIKEIEKPFHGLGVRLPNYDHLRQKANDIRIGAIKDWATRLGFHEGKWIFLEYICWGGRLESVMGLVHNDTGNFVYISSDDYQDVDKVYTELMAHFGVSENHAMDFPPFYRKFWGTY